MPNRVIRPDANDTTRDRILKAAILRFSTHSYDHTGPAILQPTSVWIWPTYTAPSAPRKSSSTKRSRRVANLGCFSLRKEKACPPL